jgi:hypothetical protein
VGRDHGGQLDRAPHACALQAGLGGLVVRPLGMSDLLPLQRTLERERGAPRKMRPWLSSSISCGPGSGAQNTTRGARSWAWLAVSSPSTARAQSRSSNSSAKAGSRPQSSTTAMSPRASASSTSVDERPKCSTISSPSASRTSFCCSGVANATATCVRAPANVGAHPQRRAAVGKLEAQLDVVPLVGNRLAGAGGGGEADA